MDTEIYVTVKQAAKELHMSEPTVRQLMAVGILQIGDTWLTRGGRRRNFKINRALLDEEKQRRRIK